MIFLIANPNVAASDILRRHLTTCVCEHVNTKGVTEQAFLVASARLNLFLVRHPMGATGSWNRLPIVMPWISDETLLRFDIDTHGLNRGENLGFTFGAVLNSIVFPDCFSAWMEMTSWHRNLTGVWSRPFFSGRTVLAVRVIHVVEPPLNHFLSFGLLQVAEKLVVVEPGERIGKEIAG